MFSAELFVPAMLFAAAAYLVGSISTAVLVCLVAGLPDPRSEGSGNPGATNVLRLAGKGPAAATLVGDLLKGLLPVALTALLFSHPPIVAIAAIATLLGHVYPVFFDFRGGKGVATAFGALLGLSFTTGALAVVTWLAVALVFRRASLAALVTFALVPIYFLIGGQITYAAAFVLIGAFLFYNHRSNVQRLIRGEEPKIGEKPPKTPNKSR